jgi:hypothetical protein
VLKSIAIVSITLVFPFGNLAEGKSSEELIPSTQVVSCAGNGEARDELNLATPFMYAYKALCQATCWDGTTVSCSGTTCNAQDEICSSNIPGYVTCGGQSYYCTTPCPPLIGCQPGTDRVEPDGCCSTTKGRVALYICNSGGSWEYQYSTCNGGCNIGPFPVE